MDTLAHEPDEVVDALRQVILGTPTVASNLAIFPLRSAQPPARPYAPFEHAVRQGAAQVVESTDTGHVPRLKVVNRCGMPVLLLDGEQLIGCKQNRVVNTSILVPAHGELDIPVSCVEQGRWQYASAAFEASERTMYAELRAAKVMQVSASRRRAGNADADQSAIWEGIAAKARRMGTRSRSGAMSGIYEARTHDVDDYLRELRCAPDQVGAIYAINGRVAGLELFDAPGTYACYARKIASGYALDAIDRRTERRDSAAQAIASSFIARLVAASSSRFPGVGLGEEVRLEGDRLAGAALAVDRRLVHLCAFAAAHPVRRAGADALAGAAPIRRSRRVS